MYFKLSMGIMACFFTFNAFSNIAIDPALVAQQFQLFQNTYHKIYASFAIAEYRKQVFADNLAKIKKHNSENHSWKLEIDESADQTLEEFTEERMLNTRYPLQLSSKYNTQTHNSTNTMFIPASVDWRTQGAVTHVKNQGQCGSSWAFAVTGAMESAGFIQLSTLTNLSEQQFLDCDTSDSACYGGQIDNALSFAIGGITRESSYPYTAKPGVCKSRIPVLQVQDYSQVPPNNERGLASAVAIQPIAIGIDANPAIFQFYKAGIINSPDCGTTLNHALLIVGYGTENGVPYWICKNSWGTAWGENGYVRISRSLTLDGGPGICGIASYPWAVNVIA